jgi:hypothetical protein
LFSFQFSIAFKATLSLSNTPPFFATHNRFITYDTKPMRIKAILIYAFPMLRKSFLSLLIAAFPVLRFTVHIHADADPVHIFAPPRQSAAKHLFTVPFQNSGFPFIAVSFHLKSAHFHFSSCNHLSLSIHILAFPFQFIAFPALLIGLPRNAVT